MVLKKRKTTTPPIDDNYVEGEEGIDPDSEDCITDEERDGWNYVLDSLDSILSEMGE